MARERRKKRRGSSSSVLNIPRGGFAPSGVANTLKGLGRYAYDKAKPRITQGINYAIDSSPLPGFGKKIARDFATKLSGKIDETVETITMVHPETMSVAETSGEPRTDKAIVKQKMRVDYQGPVKQRSFSTTYKMGERTSKSLLMAAKTNGSKTLCLFDTLNDSNFRDPSLSHREYLELTTGFNQRAYFSSTSMQPKWRAIFEDLYKIGFDTSASTNPDNQTRTVDYRIYGGALSCTNILRFRNNMLGTSAKLRVHVVGNKNQSLAPFYDVPLLNGTALATGANNTAQVMDSNKVITAGTTMPRPNYAPSGVYATDTTNSVSVYGLVTPSAKITDSPLFMSRHKIIRTFEKTLDVGDDYTLTLMNTFGSGLRLDRVLAMKTEIGYTANDSTKYAFPYFIIVELVGPITTAETNTAANYEDKFIGTAPCSVSYEAKQFFTYALESNSGVPTGALSGLTESDLGSRIGQPLIRYYVKDDVVSATPYNVSYWDATQKATPDIKINVVSSSTTQTNKTVT